MEDIKSVEPYSHLRGPGKRGRSPLRNRAVVLPSAFPHERWDGTVLGDSTVNAAVSRTKQVVREHDPPPSQYLGESWPTQPQKFRLTGKPETDEPLQLGCSLFFRPNG